MHPHTFRNARTHGGYHEIGQVGIYIYTTATQFFPAKKTYSAKGDILPNKKRNRLTMVVYGIRIKESGGRVDAKEQDGDGEGEADRP